MQVDDPQLASHWAMNPGIDLAECRNWASASVELLNHALRGIPEERVRYHTCYSINMGPRIHDMELKHIVDIMLEVRAGAYSFEAVNPQNEWRVWETANLPEDKVLIPASSPTLPIWSSIPKPSPSALRGLPASSVGKTSSQEPTADSPAFRRLVKSIPLSSGPNWRHWRKALAWQRRSCGSGPNEAGPPSSERRVGPL
jgi:hypothetical protein